MPISNNPHTASAMNLMILKEKIDEIDRISDTTWRSGLDHRKRKEMDFHDRDRNQNFIKNSKSSDTFDKFYGNKKYYSATARSNAFVKSWISKNAKGKIFLDYACGNGGNALHAAESGALLSLGFDLSAVSVGNAKEIAEKRGILNIRYFQADAENTQLPDSSVDTIICSGMLHHLDLSFAIPELRRILKPGGKILAVEALDYNPAIKAYRLLTPDMRTDWEKAHILSLKDLKFISRFLEITEVKYWHVLGYIGGKIPALSPLLNAADLLLEKIPYIQRMAWIFTFELTKPEQN